MSYNPKIHNRRSIRLKGYDYSQAGLYFITICCQDRICRYGNVVDGEMKLNDAGRIANECWLNIPEHFPNVILHEHIIMPNHIHGIIELVGANNYSPNLPENNIAKINPPQSVNEMNIGAKNISPKSVNELRNTISVYIHQCNKS